MSMMPPPGPPPQGPPQGAPSDPAVQQLLQFLASRPETQHLAAVYQQIIQANPAIAGKIARLAQQNGGQGITMVRQMLEQVAAQVGGQAGGPPPGGSPPQAAPPMGAGPVSDRPEPPPQGGPPQGMPPAGPSPGPPPPDPATMGPANSHPGSMQELLADLPPDLSRLVRSLNPQQQQMILQAFQQRGLAPIEAMLRQLQAARKGSPDNPQPTDALRRQQDGQTATPPKKQRAKDVPSFTLRSLPQNKWGDKGPTYATVRRHLDRAKEIWKPRDIRVVEDIRLYNLSRAKTADIPTGPSPTKAPNATKGDIVHVSSRPWQMIERVTSYTTATGPRKPAIDCQPWSDDDETINASQAMEDWMGYSREMDEREWMRRGANGDPRPPLPRTEASGMALMGGAGFKIGFDPEDKVHPIWSEYIPINRLYPYPGVAMIYSETMTLAEARTMWPEIDEYYPAEEEEGTGNFGQRTAPPANTTVTIGAWTDVYPKGQGGLWHGIFWVTGDTGGWGDDAERNRAKWIKPPTRIDFGFSPYQYVVWGGAPYWSTQDVDDYERFRGQGCLTALRRTFKLLDLLWSATATGALKAVDPALVMYYHPGTRKEDMRRANTAPGNTNYMIVGEKVEPLLWSVTGNPDGQAIMRALYEEISDVDNPALNGGGNANSGVQMTMQQAAASGLSMNPIMDALERYYELQNELKAELLIRKGGEGEIGKLPYPSRPADDQFDAVWPTMKTLTPEIAKLNGTGNKVTYQRLSLMEQQMLWNMVGQAVQAKMLSARDGMKLMNIGNPQRNLLRILQESAVMNPKALEAMMGAAIMGGDNHLFQIGWQQVLQANAQGTGGSPPAERGMPSAAAPTPVTGGPQGGPPQPNGPMG